MTEQPTICEHVEVVLQATGVFWFTVGAEQLVVTAQELTVLAAHADVCVGRFPGSEGKVGLKSHPMLKLGFSNEQKGKRSEEGDHT